MFSHFHGVVLLLFRNDSYERNETIEQGWALLTKALKLISIESVDSLTFVWI